MDPVVHFEFPAEDKDRMRAFYERAFGWRTKALGDDADPYVLVTTVETDEKTGFPVRPGAINGGFYRKGDDPVSRHPSVVIAVDDIQASMKRVAEAGGRVVGGVREIPGYGLYAAVIDTEGNRISMMQPNAEWMRKSPR